MGLLNITGYLQGVKTLLKWLLRYLKIQDVRQWLSKILCWIRLLVTRQHLSTRLRDSNTIRALDEPADQVSYALSSVPDRIMIPNDNTPALYMMSEISTARSQSPEVLGGFQSSIHPRTTNGHNSSPRYDTGATAVNETPPDTHSNTPSTCNDMPRELSQEYSPTMYPLLPNELSRYTKSVTIPKRELNDDLIVQPWTLHFNRHSLDHGWQRCVHPEGALYYYHEDRRIYTEANIENPTIMEKIERCILTLHNNHRADMTNERMNILDESDLVLEFEKEDADLQLCYYYFAHHSSRALFWLDDQNMKYALQEAWGEITPSHIKHAIEHFYWSHMSYFPHGHTITSELLKELKSKLIWTMMDQQSSLTSLSHYSVDELKQYISIVDHLEGLDDSVCNVAIVGRLLTELFWSNFLNYHGEAGARLNSDQSVHCRDPPRLSLSMSIFSLCLFRAPLTHLANIRSVYTDGLVKAITWKKHLNSLTSNWQEYVLYSTVLLNANIAYLEIPGITPDNPQSSTVGQVASFLSLIASSGSVIIGLLLMRQHRVNPQDDAREAHDYLLTYINRAGSIEKLATLYSVPYALLMWAMVSFFTAVSFECFNSGNIATIVMCTVAFFFIVYLSLWCTYSGSNTFEHAKSFVLGSWQHTSVSVTPLLTKARQWKRFRGGRDSSQPSPRGIV